MSPDTTSSDPIWNPLYMKADLERALSQDQFFLVYQPEIDLHTNAFAGVEALIRWRRSEQELVSPANFIPMAEDLGLINDIGEWALRTACAQNIAWQRAGMPPLRMAVNVSAHQLQQRGFCNQVRRILNETNLAPDSLELELTESALIDSLDRAPAALADLRQLVGYALLDFDDVHQIDAIAIYLARHGAWFQCFLSELGPDLDSGGADGLRATRARLSKLLAPKPG